MSRIGLVVPALGLGGGVPAVGRFLQRVAVSAGKHQVRVVSLATGSHDPANSHLFRPASWCSQPKAVVESGEGGAFVHIGARFGELEFQRYRPRRWLGEALEDCDLIQVVAGTPAWANAVIGMHKPVAVHAATRARVERRQRDTAPRAFADWWRKGMTEVTDRLDDRALSRVDAVQVENLWMLEYVREVTDGRDVDVRYAPPGVDTKWFHPRAKDEPRTASYVLCVARFSDPRKNIGLLLEAYAQLPPFLRFSVHLLLAGSSAPPASFWARADILGLQDRIVFVEKPSREMLLRLYQNATVFVLPSDEEGFGMVVIEAMACGVPVVSTCSGGPDGIITDGRDGYLVGLNDASALADRLSRLLQNPAQSQTMGDAARRKVEQCYDERVAGEVFLEMWERLARKAKAA